MLFNKLEIGQGARHQCPGCGLPVTIKQTGRRRKFCSDLCRQQTHRATAFRDKKPDLTTSPTQTLGASRNLEKTSTKSTAKTDTLADRGFAESPPIVAIGLGLHTPAQPVESSIERARLIQKAIRIELAARWRTIGGPRR
jgi:hypothetical protein